MNASIVLCGVPYNKERFGMHSISCNVYSTSNLGYIYKTYIMISVHDIDTISLSPLLHGESISIFDSILGFYPKQVCPNNNNIIANGISVMPKRFLILFWGFFVCSSTLFFWLSRWPFLLSPSSSQDERSI